MRPSLLAFLLLFPAFSQPTPYDIVISGARIVDGSGSPWFQADIGIRGDTIAAIGDLHGATAATRIDAKGLVVAPGFLDIHTHARRGIFRDPVAQNYIRQGVTTLLEGNDGNSPIPLAPFLKSLSESKLGVNFGTFAGQKHPPKGDRTGRPPRHSRRNPGHARAGPPGHA